MNYVPKFLNRESRATPAERWLVGLSAALIHVTRRSRVHPYQWGRVAGVRYLEQSITMHYTSGVSAGLRAGGGYHIFSRDWMQVPQEALEKTEGALVTEAKAGSAEAFEDLVNRYERKIYRLALRLTGNPQDAEDVLQETFLKAFEHLPDFRQDSRFYTWLVRIAVNEGLMKLRKRRSDKSEPMEDGVDDDGQVMPREFRDWKPNPEQLMSQEEMETLLMNAANSLPAGLRTVFFLRDVEELSTEETAEALNLTAGAVKARLFRARMRLREELAKVLKRE
ncbi:MAG TPA: sigma-70 family RNA polymerase sigma factor [Terriglobia bacterium]|nr:sigma-70 family RNA polymerase sigma factor [Terriglobia bacterium]